MISWEYYRYEGCPNMIEYRNVLEHEEQCKGGQYACPICPIGKCRPESVLNLLDHFKKLHKYNIINNLVVQINKGSLSRQYYLHYNPQLNVMILIFLRIDGNILSMNISNVGDEPDLIQQQVKLFRKYPEKIISTSLWRACSSWNDNLEAFDISLNDELEFCSVEFLFKESVKWTIFSQLNSLQVPREMQEPTLKKKPSRDNVSGNKAVSSCLQDYSQPSLQNKKRNFREMHSTTMDTFPRFYFEHIKKSNLKQDLKNPIFSSCGKYILNKSGDKLDVRCSFCENYYPLIDANHVFKCECGFSLCNICRSADCTETELNKCLLCSSTLQGVTDYICNRLYYYCRFDCGGHFKGSDLGRHDYYCKNSVIPGRSSEFSDQELIAKHFGPHNFSLFELHKENRFLMTKYNFKDVSGSVRRFFVIDQQGFEYIVDCETWMNGRGVTFNIHHDYDPSKYILTINIVKNKRLKKLEDCCSIEFNFQKITDFAIIFKKKE